MEPGEDGRRRPRSVVVGGSIAGLSCAHALLSAGWSVTLLEKSLSPPHHASPTGAGLGLDPQSLRLLSRWLPHPQLLHRATLPLAVDLNRATDAQTNTTRTLSRDDRFSFRAAHWADLHSLLFNALPPGVLLWGHHFLSFHISQDNSFLGIKARTIQNDQVVDFAADLLVAADGCLSAIRRHFLPDFKLRYSGYSAWRGVLDCSGEEGADTFAGLRRAYPELGNCLYFDLAQRTHCVLYELKNKKINWIWYINMPEPVQKGTSVTMKVNGDMIQRLHDEAEKVWVPELAKVIRETNDPFMNIIYDADPLPRLSWDNVVLVGDAAHPTTPHGLRSTNMSILDAGILGHCLEKWGSEKLGFALKEFERIRLPVISQQVLHARQLGRKKQGLVLHNHRTFDPLTATPDECLELRQTNMPFFEGVPFTV